MPLYEQEPEFVPESDNLTTLREYVTPLLVQRKVQRGHITMAFDLLAQTLHQMYKTTDVSLLIERSVTVNECTNFANVARECIRQSGWSRNTVPTVFLTLKKILSETTIDRDFIRRLTITEPKKRELRILPRRYTSLPADDPTLLRISGWIDRIRDNTNNKSVLSLKNIMYYFLNTLVPELCIDLSTDISLEDIIPRVTTGLIETVTGGSCRKLGWLRMFLTHIWGASPDQVGEIVPPTRKKRTKKEIFEDNADKHRISALELEEIYARAKESIRDELLYILMITTGMRVGGVVNIKTKNVSQIQNGTLEILDTGRTIEKGNKWFSFVINNQAKRLLWLWITKERPSLDSEYLFPSCSSRGTLTPGYVRILFKKWCTNAGLSGSHLHPHALRHSYAHILLESGNAPDVVSKLLGHANVSTTESFYLKENASQVAKRANIPWLNKENIQEKVVPDFLTLEGNASATPKTRGRTERRKRRNMKRLDMFNAKPLPPVEE